MLLRIVIPSISGSVVKIIDITSGKETEYSTPLKMVERTGFAIISLDKLS